jgi:FXSXX-COOH protein
MDDVSEAGNDGLVDLTGVSLADLQQRDDVPFLRSLERVIADNDDPDALTVVAFQSAV